MAFVWLLTLSLLALASPALAGDPLALPYRETHRVAVPGATAAFALDSDCVDASASDGVVTLFGRQPCATHVVIVTLTGTEELAVRVADVPARLPPGYVPAAGRGGLIEQGTYELRYSSAPAVVQNIVNLVQRHGDRTSQLHANLAAGTGGTPEVAAVSLPTAFYRVASPRGSITVLDSTVIESPLTVEGAILRGAHAEYGPWRAHAGYTALATFEEVFLPAAREAAAGLSYTHRLSPRSALVPSLYYFPDTGAPTPSGVAATLRYETLWRPGTRARAEVGVSRGLGASFDIDHVRGETRARARASCKPEDYASLAVNAPGGCLLDAGWNRSGPRLVLDGSGAYSRYTQPDFAHTNALGTFTATWRLSPHWSVHGGFAGSMFESRRPAPLRYEQVGVPLGLDYGTGRIGLGLRYQPSFGRDSNASGDLWRVSGRWAMGPLSLSAFAEHQTRVLATGHLVSSVPGLQQALDRLGLAATSPEAVSALLRDTAVLAALGYTAPITLDITPERVTLWAGAHWTSSRRLAPRVSLTSLVMRNDEPTGREASAIHSASLTQPLGRGWEGSVSWSVVARSDGNRAPLWLVSIRPGGVPVPNLLFPARTTTITGTVVGDTGGRGGTGPDAPGIAGVDIVLDGVRTTRTDRDGRFSFTRVPDGRHEVEARYASPTPFYFTSASRVEVTEGRPVSFAIGFSLGRVFGYVRNDAGVPLPGIRLRVVGPEGPLAAETDGQGRFEVLSLRPATYRVDLEAESVPPGYAIDRLEPVEALVSSDAPARAEFVVPAHRTVAGRVRVFDAATGTYRPGGARTVRLRELDRTCRTDDSGAFVFRDLPAGEHTLAVDEESGAVAQTVRLTGAPTLVRDLEIVLPRR
jgi:hypothetical protein